MFSSKSSSSTPAGMALIETALASVKASGGVIAVLGALLVCMALFYESFSSLLGTQDPSAPTVYPVGHQSGSAGFGGGPGCIDAAGLYAFSSSGLFLRK